MLSDHWQPSSQQYQLGEFDVTRQLLTKEKLLEIARRRPESSNRFSGHVQQASFLEEVDEDQPESEMQSKSKEDVTPLSVTGSNAFSQMNENELREQIQKFRESIAEDVQAGDSVKTSRLQILTAANESILKWTEFQSQKTRYDAQIRNVKEEESTLQNQLQSLGDAVVPVVDDFTTSDELSTQLEKYRFDLKSEKQRLNDLEKQIQIRSKRSTEIPVARSNATESREQIQNEITKRTETGGDIDKELVLLLNEIKLKAIDAELKFLDSESKRLEQTAKLDPMHRDLLSRKVGKLDEEVRLFVAATKLAQQREVEDEERQASEAAARAHHSLRPLAEENEALVQDRKNVVENLQNLRNEFEEVTRQVESIVKRRTEIKNKIDAGGLTDTNGMLLVDLRRNLQTTGESHVRIRQLSSQLQQINLAKVGLIEKRDGLSDPIEVVGGILNNQDLENSLVQKAIEFVESQRNYLGQLIDDYQTYGRKVSEVSEVRKKLIDEINQTTIYVDENALWVRSSEPIAPQDFVVTTHGLGRFFHSQGWHDVVMKTGNRAVRNLYELGTVILIFVALVGINYRVQRNLDHSKGKNESST
ncbi:MAG: hypothetical protein AAGA30_02955 [Planctomycetota bacterium]